MKIKLWTDEPFPILKWIEFKWKWLIYKRKLHNSGQTLIDHDFTRPDSIECTNGNHCPIYPTCGHDFINPITTMLDAIPDDAGTEEFWARPENQEPYPKPVLLKGKDKIDKKVMAQ